MKDASVSAAHPLNAFSPTLNIAPAEHPLSKVTDTRLAQFSNALAPKEKPLPSALIATAVIPVQPANAFAPIVVI